MQTPTHFAVARLNGRRKFCDTRRCKKRRVKIRQKRRKPKPGGERKELLCRKAAQLLVDEGFLSEFKFSPALDECGIDLVLFKHIRPRSRMMRIALHLQIKQCSGDTRRSKGVLKHKSRYPSIPVFCVPRNLHDAEKIKEQLRNFFCAHFEGTRYYAFVLQQTAA